MHNYHALLLFFIQQKCGVRRNDANCKGGDFNVPIRNGGSVRIRVHSLHEFARNTTYARLHKQMNFFSIPLWKRSSGWFVPRQLLLFFLRFCCAYDTLLHFTNDSIFENIISIRSNVFLSCVRLLYTIYDTTIPAVRISAFSTADSFAMHPQQPSLGCFH